MNPCPNHEQLQVLGFCQAFVKRAARGAIGVGAVPSPIQYWHRRFQALPDDERTKLASFALTVFPHLLSKNAGLFSSVARGLEEAAPAVARAAPRLRVLEGEAAAGAEAAARARPFPPPGPAYAPPAGTPPPGFRAQGPATGPIPPPPGYAPPPVPPFPTRPPAIMYPPSSPVVPAVASSTLPLWAQKALTAYQGMPRWQRALTIGGIGYPLYQLSQGQAGPMAVGGSILANILTMGRGGVMPWVAPIGAWYAGERIDPMLGWKPQEQRLQEAMAAGQQQGQQEMLSAVQQRLAAQPPMVPSVGGPTFTANRLAITSPEGSYLRPDLTMPFQMMQRRAMEQAFPGM